MGRFHGQADACTNRHAAAVDAPGVSELSFVQALVTPGTVFGNQHEVVDHPWFTHHEKRAVLSSWARDELMTEQNAFRTAAENELESRFDGVVRALARFDALAAGEYLSAMRTIRACYARPRSTGAAYRAEIRAEIDGRAAGERGRPAGA